MKVRNIFITALMSTPGVGICAPKAIHFDMALDHEGKITEQVSQQTFTVFSQLPPCTQTGPDGQALFFDGYSNYIKAEIPVTNINTSTLTLSVILAAQSYPMMKINEAETEPTYATICGNLDHNAKQGFAWLLSSQGDLRFSWYNGGDTPLSITATEKLPCGTWNKLDAVFNSKTNNITLYLNGEAIHTGRVNRTDLKASSEFYIGKGAEDIKKNGFLLNTFCGLIDDISITNDAVAPQSFTPSYADFNYPVSRYESNLWRPHFHGMPSAAWTNESHGMIYSNGKYHVFFQKNANGPYMARLHWGHISSTNLYDWYEEPIALAPDESYDKKGCWSGCVYDDNGIPTILYTAVDNTHAVIAKAHAKDADLKVWQKDGIIIDGRPNGLSDDFRDPYYFEANGNKYIIVGTSANNRGACTLHKYENGTWTNDGTLFFQAENTNEAGTFWEMPTVTPIGNGKWLFTCTPLNTGVGVRTIAWVGTIGNNGKFTPTSGIQYIEMGGISKDGYGLLSPTIYQQDGKTLLIGIVPDKLPTLKNYEMGWAHNYSLPRELTIDTNDNLIQIPYRGLAEIRFSENFQKSLTLIGEESFGMVSGRQLELEGEFTINTGNCGFHFLKSGEQQAVLSYHSADGTLTLDLTALHRITNDDGSYKGIYTTTLPQKINTGETLKLHVYLDGSIADIFVNDMWAFSTRIFPTDTQAVAAEAFATASTKVNLKAWKLDTSQTNNIMPIANVVHQLNTTDRRYDLEGKLLPNTSMKSIYIQNGKKFTAK